MPGYYLDYNYPDLLLDQGRDNKEGCCRTTTTRFSFCSDKIWETAKLNKTTTNNELCSDRSRFRLILLNPPPYPGHPHPDPRPNGHLPQEVRFVKSPGSQFLARFSQASFSDQCDQNFTTEKLALNLSGMQRYFSNVGGMSPNPQKLYFTVDPESETFVKVFPSLSSN